MLYVVDASVVVKWFLPEPNRDKAMKLLTDFRDMSVDSMRYIVLASQLGCEFITADKTVVNKLGSKFIRRLGDL